MVRSLPVFVESFKDINQYFFFLGPLEQLPQISLLKQLTDVLWWDSAPVRRCGPACLGDDDLLVRVGALNRIEILTGVRHCLRYRFVFPHRVGMNGDDIQFFSEAGELIQPGNVVFAESHRLRDAFAQKGRIGCHSLGLDKMVRPVDGRLVAHGYDVDNRVIAISPHHGTI